METHLNSSDNSAGELRGCLVSEIYKQKLDIALHRNNSPILK